MKTAIPTPPVMPADRSISAMISRKVRAIARIISAAVWVSRFAMFLFVRKNSLRSENSTPSTSVPARAGSMPISPERTRLK